MMARCDSRPPVAVIGGGMITRIQLLPSLYHLQRQGAIGKIDVCALNAAPPSLAERAGESKTRGYLPTVTRVVARYSPRTR